MYSFIVNKLKNNFLSKIISSPFFCIVVPPVIGFYYLVLDIWGDEWSIIANNKEIHEKIFVVLFITTMVLVIYKGILEQKRANASSKYHELLKELMLLINNMVKRKKDRFHRKATNINRTGDWFKQITQPEKQISFALDASKSFIAKGFGVDRKNICLTIIAGNKEQNKWQYKFKCDRQTQHTEAKKIMDNKESTARYCYDNGESLFVPDIRKAIKEKIFLPSERFNRKKSGSIFCKPVRVNTNKHECVYILTIVVYGELLCTPYDVNECEAAEHILDEISDRIELELYLLAMKLYREGGGNMHA